MLLFEKKFEGRWKIMVIVIREECIVKGNKKIHEQLKTVRCST